MNLEITQEDIDKGMRNNICRCPVALALRRRYPGKNWKVSRFMARSEVLSFRMLKNAYQFINKFDDGKHVEPTTLELIEA